MGSGSSRSNTIDETHSEKEEPPGNNVVPLMMPVYYDDQPISNEEMELASNTWKLILTNTSPEFMARRRDPRFQYPTCIMYFYNSFYQRLFDIHPMARDLFKDMSSQGKFLVKMISLSLSEKADPVKYEKTLIKLAEIHCDRGVKAVEYGLVGDVLFWTIKLCVGGELYTPEVHTAWVKVYSRMLKTMVPVAVEYEMKHGCSQPKRFRTISSGSSVGTEDSTFIPKKDDVDLNLQLHEHIAQALRETNGGGV
eukprot:gene214-229_t